MERDMASSDTSDRRDERKPWVAPEVIVSTAPETDKIFTYEHVNPTGGTMFGPS